MNRKIKQRANQQRRQLRSIKAMEKAQENTNLIDQFILSGGFDHAMQQVIDDLAKSNKEVVERHQKRINKHRIDL